MTGYIHSFQSMGAVDGPGLRCVVFMQGCPLRCCYCHNPDTWDITKGQPVTPEEMVEKILRFRPYFGKNGGVTLSGGEPLLQPGFATRLFTLLKEQGIHTALDTSGQGDLTAVDDLLAVTDLVLCDIKFPTEDLYRTHCKAGLSQTLHFLQKVTRHGVPLWIRHVILPGLTDHEASLRQVYDLGKQFPTLERWELLPFKALCREKYRALNIPFPMENTPECPDETIQRLYQTIQQWEK